MAFLGKDESCFLRLKRSSSAAAIIWPSFIKAAEPVLAEKLYKLFVSKLRGLGIKVETGSFGEYMEIDAELDGPVTIIMEWPLEF